MRFCYMEKFVGRKKGKRCKERVDMGIEEKVFNFVCDFSFNWDLNLFIF